VEQAGPAARSPHRQRRVESIAAAPGEVTSHLPAAEACRREGAIACLASLPALVTVSEECGLSTEDARLGIAWAIDTRIAAAAGTQHSPPTGKAIMTDTHAMPGTPLTHAFARRPGAGSSRAYLGHLFSFLADSGQTNGGLAIIEVTVRQGLEPPPHTHSREDETYYILDGRWSFDADREPFDAEPGSLVFLPRGVAHHFSIDGDAARALVILTPGGRKTHSGT
jgi:quercetin dioxygenase-like cupin family protein